MNEWRQSQLLILWISSIWTWFVVEISFLFSPQSKSKAPVRLKAVMQGGLLLFYQFFFIRGGESVCGFHHGSKGTMAVTKQLWWWWETLWQRSQRSSSSLHFQSLNEHFFNNLQSRDGAKGKKCFRAAKMRWVGVGVGGGRAAVTLISVACERIMMCSSLRESHREEEDAHAFQQCVTHPTQTNGKRLKNWAKPQTVNFTFLPLNTFNFVFVLVPRLLSSVHIVSHCSINSHHVICCNILLSCLFDLKSMFILCGLWMCCFWFFGRSTLFI